MSVGDVSWLQTPSLRPATVVSDYVSPSFEAYARVLNPALDLTTGKPISWSRVAAPRRVVVDGATQWHHIEKALPLALRRLIQPPEMGTISWPTARALTKHLPSPPEGGAGIMGAVWTGYADVPSGPTIALSRDREYVIVTGSIDSVPAGYHVDAFERIPLRRWPSDHSWCIGNDIYARSVFVGATQTVIDMILTDPALEAYPVTPDMPVHAEDL
jgi:hypothetical protein